MPLTCINILLQMSLHFYQTQDFAIFYPKESPLDVFRRWKLLWNLRNLQKEKKNLILRPDPYGSISDLAIPTEHDAALEGKVL